MPYELKHTIEGKAKMVAFHPLDNTTLLSLSTKKKNEWQDYDMVYLWKEIDKKWTLVKEFKPNVNITKYINWCNITRFPPTKSYMRHDKTGLQKRKL